MAVTAWNPRRWAGCLTVAFATWLCIGGEDNARQVLLQEGFEKGTDAWQTEGAAEFTADTEKPHGGAKTAKITVTEKPAYQKLVRYVDENATQGSSYHASVWVRTAGVSANPGAYIVFEFFDGDRRVDVSHGGMATDATARDWQQLEVEGQAPAGARRVRVALLLHATATAWFDDVEVTCVKRKPPPEKPAGVCAIRVETEKVVQAQFGGVGFHCSEHEHTITKDFWEQTLAKRWRELRPAFARLGHHYGVSQARKDVLAQYLLLMKETQTEAYLATWNPKDTPAGPERAAYAKQIVDDLEYLVRTKGCTNLKYYCMTNELSLKQWGALKDNLPKFKSYHQCLYDELAARKLEIKLLATDASPIAFWPTIEWAAKNMDGITGIYGGHHYINDHALENDRFYEWFLGKIQWAAGLARAKGKSFVLGEFGSKQDGRTVDGVKLDRCIYYETPQEPLAALQVCEAALAAINGGAYALGYWTFADYPDGYSKNYINKWGTFRWSKDDHSTRAVYYSYGLLTRLFRGPATVFTVSSSDPLVRAAAVQHHDSKTWSIAVLNRYKAAAPVTITLPAAQGVFRRYVYDTARVATHLFGDMPPPSGEATPKDGVLEDTVAPLSLTVYTTACDNEPPAAVKVLKIEGAGARSYRIAWQASTEPDFCYYRVYRGTRQDFSPSSTIQIGSTIATEFLDTEAGPAEPNYKVLAVDQSGNASKP